MVTTDVFSSISSFIAKFVAFFIAYSLYKKATDYIYRNNISLPSDRILRILEISWIGLLLAVIFDIIAIVLLIVTLIVNVSLISLLTSLVLLLKGIILKILFYILVFFVILLVLEIIPKVNINLPFIKELLYVFTVLVLIAGFAYFLNEILSSDFYNILTKINLIILLSLAIFLFPILLNIVRSFAETYLNMLANVADFGWKDILLNIILVVFSISYIAAIASLIDKIFSSANTSEISAFLTNVSSALGQVIWYAFLISISVAVLYYVTKR